jgi:AcrR family transcriptional regulator
MARIKSGDKRSALLEAAIVEFAARGVWSTPTSAISKAAGVAEGTLFTYFASKDVLLNALYREIKRELADVMLSAYPAQADARTRLEHIWKQYVHWGVAQPARFNVMSQLRMSEQVTQDSRDIGAAPFAALDALARDSIARRIIRDQPVAFIAGMLGAMAEATMLFVAGASSAANGCLPGDAAAFDYCAAGFDTFWRGIAVT